MSGRAATIPEGRAREIKIKQQHSTATAQTVAHNKGGSQRQTPEAWRRPNNVALSSTMEEEREHTHTTSSSFNNHW